MVVLWSLHDGVPAGAASVPGFCSSERCSSLMLGDNLTPPPIRCIERANGEHETDLHWSRDLYFLVCITLRVYA